MKLQDIINTDCYIEFDSNEQLREWVKANGKQVDFQGTIFNDEEYIRFIKGNSPFSLFLPEFPNFPHYHHTTIEL